MEPGRDTLADPPPTTFRDVVSRPDKFTRLLLAFFALTVLAAACGGDDTNESSSFDRELVIGAIPDQDPEILARNYDLLATYLQDELGVAVRFQPVTAYEAAVTGFRVGDLQLVWFGGLTGVQARLEVEGANAIAQREIDERFTSVFIAGTDTDIGQFETVQDLARLAGHTFTFGSASSTSGRLMPQSFLAQAGLGLASFARGVGVSGSHDQTIALVEAGTYESGVLNSQVWDARVASGDVDTSRVQVVLETPQYYDYHWVAHPELGELESRIIQALTDLDPSVEAQAEILEFFGAESFIETTNANYDDIEKIGREIGRISD
jgi:phosphonate transport system substrate-binding protein